MSQPIQATAIHHITLTVSDVQRSQAFYAVENREELERAQRVLGERGVEHKDLIGKVDTPWPACKAP
jgi:catechol 2,3-dioxygenase-like lactoylglutathione lyase family enzyme